MPSGLVGSGSNLLFDWGQVRHYEGGFAQDGGGWLT